MEQLGANLRGDSYRLKTDTSAALPARPTTTNDPTRGSILIWVVSVDRRNTS
jgi:hypothetical protein